MASPARPLAKCVARWIYEQASSVLKMLKAMLLTVIAYIDLQIAYLRAQLAQWDYLANKEQAAWEQFEKIIEAIRKELESAPEGPLAEFCPEFYQYFLDPARSLFEASVETLTIHRQQLHNIISYMDEVDLLIKYWEDVKTQLVACVDIIDDSIYIAAMREADRVP